jgi:hypothetical protein
MALPVRKVETMRAVTAVVDDIVAALSLETAPRRCSDVPSGVST